MNKDIFMSRIRRAAGNPHRSDKLFADVPSSQSLAILERIRSTGSNDRARMLEKLRSAAEPLRINVYSVPDPTAAGEGITRLVLDKEPEWGEGKRVVSWRHPLIDRTGISNRLPDMGIPLIFTEPVTADHETRARLRSEIAASFIGITSADFCLSETATLVLRTRPGNARSVSLVPSIHVAVISEKQLLPDLKSLYALLRWEPGQQAEGLTSCLTFISGPSKTADIEATLVHGAHGPRELHLFVCESEA